MKNLFFATLMLFINACTPSNPHPEQLDPIYKDLAMELGIANKALEEEEKRLVSANNEKSLAVPQTGQIKFSNKKIADSTEKINILKQQKLYF